MDRLYNMKPGETAQYMHYNVYRVPGGWLFEYRGNSAFVPYNTEFSPDQLPY